LEYYGIRGAVLNWLKSYLSNRKQRVTLNFFNPPHYFSEWEVVKRGVPQGSVLGPLLFNLYLTDFPSIVNESSNTMEHHGIFTRQIKNLHLPQVNLTMYQKGVYYSGIGVFNGLPTDIKDISDSPVKFKTALKHFLYLHSFYTLEEYYNR
jgi:hypothetical protein